MDPGGSGRGEEERNCKDDRTCSIWFYYRVNVYKMLNSKSFPESNEIVLFFWCVLNPQTHETEHPTSPVPTQKAQHWSWASSMEFPVRKGNFQLSQSKYFSEVQMYLYFPHGPSQLFTLLFESLFLSALVAWSVLVTRFSRIGQLHMIRGFNIYRMLDVIPNHAAFKIV